MRFRTAFRLVHFVQFPEVRVLQRLFRSDARIGIVRQQLRHQIKAFG